MTNGHAKISFSMMGGCKDLILDDGRRPHAICPSCTPASSAMLPGVHAPCSGCVSSDRPLLCKSESAEASCNPSAQRTASAAGSAHARSHLLQLCLGAGVVGHRMSSLQCWLAALQVKGVATTIGARPWQETDLEQQTWNTFLKARLALPCVYHAADSPITRLKT